MGKTAVFVLSLLHRIELPPDPCSVIVLSHTRELAFQIKNEFDRFTKHLRDVTTEVIYGGVPISK
jgi:ATP-dependent RNA helicase UAP56/SUB2